MNLSEHIQLPKKFGYLNTRPIEPLKKKEHFDLSLKPLKDLGTFVDLKQQIKDLNIMQEAKVIQLIRQLKYEAKNKSILQQSKNQRTSVVAIGRQLEIELDILQSYDDDISKIPKLIDLVQLKFPTKNLATIVRESAAMLDTHYNIHRIKDKIHTRTPILHHGNAFLEEVSKMGFLSGRNSDEQDFYKGVINQKKQNDKNILEDDLTIKQKFRMLKNYLRKRGIEIKKNEEIPNQAYSQNFTQRSNFLIKQVKDMQIQKLGLHRRSGTQTNLFVHTDQTPIRRTYLEKPIIATVKSTRFSSSIDIKEKFKNFVTKTQALEQYYQSENQDCLNKLEQLSNEVEQPLVRHFDNFIEIKMDKEEQQKYETDPELLKKKDNRIKKLRMQKIFKSQMQS